MLLSSGTGLEQTITTQPQCNIPWEPFGSCRSWKADSKSQWKLL